MAMNDPYQMMQQPQDPYAQQPQLDPTMMMQQQPAPEPPPSTPDMIDQLIQDTINDTTLNKDVQAKVILTLAQAIDTLARPELEMLKLQQQEQQPKPAPKP